MGKNYSENLHSIKNTWNNFTEKQMFDRSEKLIVGQSNEIYWTNETTWEHSSWKYLSLVGERVMMEEWEKREREMREEDGERKVDMSSRRNAPFTACLPLWWENWRLVPIKGSVRLVVLTRGKAVMPRSPIPSAPPAQLNYVDLTKKVRAAIFEIFHIHSRVMGWATMIQPFQSRNFLV